MVKTLLTSLLNMRGDLSLRKRAIRATFWAASGIAGQKSLQLLSNLILTRLLFPEVFGLMALANVTIVALAMFSELGLKPAIVQSDRGDDPKFLNTAWSVQILRGFTLWLSAAALAYPISRVYGQADLFALICLLGCSAAITGFASTSMATGERNLAIQRTTLVQLIGQAATVAVTVLFAWLLRSVWALAFGAIIGAIVTTTLSHTLIPSHRHRFVFERESLLAIRRFSQWIFFATIVTFLGGQGLRAIQGLYLTPSDLGILTIAQTLAWMPGEIALLVMRTVGFPALSEIHKRKDGRFSEVLQEMRKKVVFTVTPFFIILSIFSEQIINLLYDSRYSDAASYLSISAIGGAVSTLSLGYQNAFLAMGNSRLHFSVLLVAMALRILGLVVGYHFAHVEGMLIGIAIGSFISFIFVFRNAQKLFIASLGIDAVCLGVIASVILISWGLYGS